VVQRQRRRRCGVLSLGISESEEGRRAAFEWRGALARRKDRNHQHRTYGPANDVPQRWPAHALTPAFSYSVACKDQAEIDRYWEKLLEGGKPMACGWLTDKFGLCWQIVPEKIGEILKHPKAMAAMMKMVKFDIATLEAAAKE
jgi:hypothetical protein